MTGKFDKIFSFITKIRKSDVEISVRLSQQFWMSDFYTFIETYQNAYNLFGIRFRIQKDINGLGMIASEVLAQFLSCIKFNFRVWVPKSLPDLGIGRNRNLSIGGRNDLK